MRWAVRIFLVLVALVSLIYLVGTRLPESHHAAAQRVMAAPPGPVWAAITDVRAFPEWRPGVDRVEVLDARNGLPVWRERGSGGDLTLSVLFLEPGQRMVARVDDRAGDFGGTWTYDLAPAPGGGTQVTLTEDGEIYNPLFRVVARFVTGYTSTMEGYLDALSARVEDAGE